MQLANTISGLATLALALASRAATVAASSSEQTAAIHIQPITASPAPPSLLAEIRYDLAASPAGATTPAEVAAFEFPELPEGVRTVRVGVWDAAAQRWAGATSVASAENFAKGYAPHLVLSVVVTEGGDGDDGQEKRREGRRELLGEVVGAAVRGVRIDAGQTRDFGPQALVSVAAKGKQPDLNKPVVLSPDGKQPAEAEEKTLLQRYWWVIGIILLLTLTGGGGGEGEGGGS